MHAAMTKVMKGKLDETTARITKVTMANFSQLFLYLRGLRMA
jgi:hypothetical protein